ncbi:MAG: DUF3857 domain-containing protein, partial [Acidobacteriota bacterium]|nr:DUF3857 domain-containing protein [Acidobacteriota bacterium]
MRRWFCNTSKPASSIKHLCFAFYLAVLVFGSAVSPATASDSAPDWLLSAAQQKLADYPKDTKSVILLDDTTITVQTNGDIFRRHRMAIRLLRPEATERYRVARVTFDKDSKVMSLKAWTMEPDGRVIAASEKEVLET